MSTRSSSRLGVLIRGANTDRVRAFWRVLLPVVVGSLALSLSGALARSFGVNRGQMMLAAFGGTTLVAVGLLGVSARYLDKRPVVAYGYHLSRAWWRDSVVGVGLGMLLVTITFVIARTAGSLTVTGTDSFTGGSFLLWILLFFVAFVGVAFYEELIYRGIFITNAIEGLTARGYSRPVASAVALLGSTVAFSLVHVPSALVAGANPGLVAAKTLAFGGLLGLAYVLTGELALPMGIHLGVNVAQMNLFGIGSSTIPGIPVVLGVEHAGTGLWNPSHGLPMIAATIVGALLVAGWCYVQSESLTIKPMKRNRRRSSLDD